jgi:23S rRNA G2445 N2-methylase RlmL
MEYIAICPEGLEDITQLEIKEILSVDSQIAYKGRVKLKTDKIQLLIEKTQSIIKIYEFKQEIISQEEVKAFEIESPFRVNCARKKGSTHGHSTQVVAKDVGEIFFKAGNEVDLTSPKTIIFVDILDTKMFVGIDLTPKLLSKRDYKIKIHNQSINSCIAYSVVRLSGFDDTKTLLDPFSKDGTIAIEAATYKKGKVYAIDSLFHNIKSVEVNSKLAGLRKDIQISRIDVEWLDTKFKEKEIDCLVSAVPYPSKHVPEKEVKKLYKELFYHLDYILKKGARVVLLAPKIDILKELNEKLQIIEEREIGTSNFRYKLIILSK